MNNHDLKERRKFGEDLARAAGEFALSKQKNIQELAVDMKGTQDWVTNADRETEQLVRAKIAEAFPQDNILGEEEGGMIDGISWIVDPIDGTANFAHGTPYWCVSIALVQDGQAMLGFVYAPALDELFVAQRDAGAWLNAQALDCRRDVPAVRSVIELSWRRGDGFRAYKDQVEQLLDVGYEFCRAGAGALSLAWIGTRRQEGYGEVNMNAWDGMAGWLIAREAGASVNAYDLACLEGKKADIAVGATDQIRDDLLGALGNARQRLLAA
ncbi:MAG: inositol monophosphatase [Rhodobacteraceae bacterium]|nr:inositol monophosphatase [Paracoccaceae bacterium]